MPDVSGDVEKGRQHCSRIAQTLNVPQRVRLGPSLAAASLVDLFERPTRRHLVNRSPMHC